MRRKKMNINKGLPRIYGTSRRAALAPLSLTLKCAILLTNPKCLIVPNKADYFPAVVTNLNSDVLYPFHCSSHRIVEIHK